MNTPSHAIINLAIVTNLPLTQANLAVVVGAILPDLPIFIFYFWAKFVLKQPEAKIWTESYWQPQMQTWVALLHSIPLASFAAIISHYFGWPILELIFISMVLHSLGDLPVHHDDAHRHFFPLHDYRFISPISYWDPNRYGRVVALIEIILVGLATVNVFPSVESWFGKGLMLAVNGFYVATYLYFNRRFLATGN